MPIGISAFNEALKQGRQKSPTATNDREGGYGPRLDPFILKSDEQKILRFLTDDIWTGYVYDFILCNDGKTRNFVIEDGGEDWVAKYARPTPGVGWRQRPRAQIEEPLSRKQGINVAVVRDEIPDGKGGTQVIDHIYDLPIGEKTYKARKFVLVRQALPNFWQHLDGCLRRYGTFCDRDYQIGRVGADKTTAYNFTPLDPIEGLRDPEDVQTEYGYGRPWPLPPNENASAAEQHAYDERFMFCPQTITDWLGFFGSEAWAKRHLSGPETVSPSLAGSGKYSGLDEFRAPDEAQVEVTPGEEFASLRERIFSKGKKEAT